MTLSRFLSLSIITIIISITSAIIFLYVNRNEYVKEIIIEQASLALGSSVSLEEVDVKPFNYSISISNFSVQNPSSFPKKEALGFKNITIQLPSQISFQPFHIQSISIEKPRIHLFYETDRNNLQTLINNTQSSSSSTSENYKIKIDSLTIENAQTSITSSLTLGRTISLNMPSLAFQNIGKENGIPPNELAQLILSAISSQTINAFKKPLLDFKNNISETLDTLIKNTENTSQNLIDEASKTLNNLFGN